jgi:dihydrofolate reductase
VSAAGPILVAAVARNGVIGRDGGIPWHLPEDLARFRELTLGRTVVMGRRTWESLPDRFRPLPGRRNVVVTRQHGYDAPGAEVVASLEAALAHAGDAEVAVIGGAELYAAALHLASTIELTELDLEVEGDVAFPDWERSAFDEVAREERVTDDGLRYAFVTYRRRP